MSENNTFLTSNPHDIRWWGEHEFKLNISQAWQFGSLLFRITRSVQEWRLEYYRPSVQYDYEQTWHRIEDPNFSFPQPLQIERYMFKSTQSKLKLLPRLADRPVVIKPVDPIYIPAGQRGTLYISTPLWLSAYIDGHRDPIFDLPIILPKDTWFGPNHRTGQICYATAVDGRTELKDLTRRAFRAVTSIEFQNTSNQQIRFDRISVPVPALPLFYSEKTGRLWTSQIKIMHESLDKLPRIRLDNRSPALDGKVSYLQPPREHAGNLFNMFESFF